MLLFLRLQTQNQFEGQCSKKLGKDAERFYKFFDHSNGKSNYFKT